MFDSTEDFLCLFLCAYCYFLRLRLQASWKYVFIYKIHTTKMVDVLRFYCNGHKDGNLLITHTILYLLQLNWIEEATDNVLSFSLSLSDDVKIFFAIFYGFSFSIAIWPRNHNQIVSFSTWMPAFQSNREWERARLGKILIKTLQSFEYEEKKHICTIFLHSFPLHALF